MRDLWIMPRKFVKNFLGISLHNLSVSPFTPRTSGDTFINVNFPNISCNNHKKNVILLLSSSRKKFLLFYYFTVFSFKRRLIALILQGSTDTKKSSGFLFFEEKKTRKTIFYTRNKPDFSSLTSLIKDKKHNKKLFGEK